MYRKKDRNTEMLFKELMPFGGKLNDGNRWLRLRELIPWEELEEEYQKYFSKRGRPGIDGQLVIGVICIKHMLKVSDNAVIEHVMENPYMQAFCGLESFAGKELFDESSLSKLRKRLGKELDKKVRTYRRKARCKYLIFSKRRKKTWKVVKQAKKAKKAMLQYVRRNMVQLHELFEEIKKKGGQVKKGFVERFEVVRKIYDQQLKMYKEKTHRVKDRIVSFHQPQVRPMVRGKAGKEVEFGPKGELSLIDGYLFVDELSFDNFNESTKLKDSIKLYESRFGEKPQELIADMIYGSRENRHYLKEKEIKAGLNPLGRIAQTQQAKKHRQWVKKKQKERNYIEGMIGHGKEHFGLDKIHYKIKDGAEIWVRMGLMMMNLNTALKRV